MPCDLLWALRCPNFKYFLRVRGNEEYCCEKITSKWFWSKLLKPDPKEKNSFDNSRKFGYKRHGTMFRAYDGIKIKKRITK
jgi:hypothetical protein